VATTSRRAVFEIVPDLFLLALGQLDFLNGPLWVTDVFTFLIVPLRFVV
jgi:hypothetical protein